ncbi:MAG: NAD(P)-dependent oxidoreductase [Candidatus Azobacteroides sp.]|nr:NAD(P)-dependent oxidoreductase [Candidatus Azobacteroides sp.]
MKNILITGASGFIGSFLVEKALNRNWKVWAGIRQTGSKKYLSDERISFIDLFYSDKDKLKQQIENHRTLFGKWDYVIHNAGVTKCLHTEDFEKINYGFTRNLIEALKEAGAVPDKFILMSSLSAAPPTDSIYGKSKRKAEEFLEAQTDFPFVILRPTGVYGPRDKDYFLMLKSIKKGLELTAGYEPQILTFIYVTDLAEVALLAAESAFSRKTYNVSDGNTYSDETYTQIAKKTLGKERVLKLRVPLIVLKTVSGLAELCSKISKKPSTLNRDKYKIMKRRDWTCDISPLICDLGFQAEYDLERGIRECVTWYANQGWL